MRIFGFGAIGLVVVMTFVVWVQTVLFLVAVGALLIVSVGQALPVSTRKFYFGRSNSEDEGPDAITLHFEQARFALMLICIGYFFFGAWMALTIPRSLTAQIDPGSTTYLTFYVYTYLSMLPAILLFQFVRERWFLMKAEATVAQSSLRGNCRYYWFTINGHEYGGMDGANFKDSAPFVFFNPKNPDNCRSPYQFGFHRLTVKPGVA